MNNRSFQYFLILPLIVSLATSTLLLAEGRVIPERPSRYQRAPALTEEQKRIMDNPMMHKSAVDGVRRNPQVEYITPNPYYQNPSYNVQYQYPAVPPYVTNQLPFSQEPKDPASFKHNFPKQFKGEYDDFDDQGPEGFRPVWNPNAP